QQEGEVRECGSERGRLGLPVGIRIEERISERGVEAKSDLALHVPPGGRRGIAIELVEQAWDRVGPVRVEFDRLVGPWSKEQEPDLLRWHDLDDLVGRGAA